MGANRSYSSPSRRAAPASGSSYEPRGQRFEVHGKACDDIEVELRGIARPNEIPIFGAHYDSVPGTSGGSELVISELACRIGRWSLLATLIHELAHINGASGRGFAAEDALIACGLGRRQEQQTGMDDTHNPTSESDGPRQPGPTEGPAGSRGDRQ
jgi:hypothetical protein